MKPIRWLLLLIGVCGMLAFPPTAPAQHMDNPAKMRMSSDTANIIDGAVHPEMIRDATAYRLWLIAVSEAPSGAPSRRQRALLQAAGLPDKDIETASTVLADFNVRYAELIAAYNATVTTNPNASDALPRFIADREALVQDVRDNLHTGLSAVGMAGLDIHVRSEKARMKVAKGDQ